ncbi:adhesion G protein-coupled receptor L1 [Astyanax mexicanus]|uniref:Adhesion G protein-coupled receptor L1 n=1 Tax=Astyanax mexicanus TaxID=7994 RepID=A0A8T2LPV0_ASTMX|nr:adhesion G protein-coupled receptor L1 [Astyanax mexicanus]
MASRPAGDAQPLTLRHGVRCEAGAEVSLESVLLAIGEQVGCDNIVSASRMYRAVVVFVKDRELVHTLVEHGITTVWIQPI